MSEESDVQAANEARDILAAMLEHLGIEATVERYRIEESTLLHVESPEAGRLIGRGGQTLDAFQFLINRIMRNRYEDPPRIIVDVERYRERRRDELVKRARKLADKVRRWGEPVQMDPMNSFDRRIVHMALRDDADVETVSPPEPDEQNRKPITIRLRGDRL